MIRRIIAAGVVSAFLAGCSGSLGSMPDAGSTSVPTDSKPGSEPVTGAAMPEGSVPMAGNPEAVPPAPAVDPYIESIASEGDDLVFVPVTETSELAVTTDFLFDTSRTVKVKLAVNAAFGKRGSLSLCTDYHALDSGFSVDYDSCLVRAYISDGQFESEMSLVNQHDSLIAVLWFLDQDKEPLYHEFAMADLVPGVDGPEWRWN